MATKIQQSIARAAWRLARNQHMVITREQLRALGFSQAAIRHRLATGRLHAIHAGVYAVGHAELTRLGTFIAAVLACGREAALSHASAGELWRILPPREGDIEVSLPRSIERNGITPHRRTRFERTRRHGIPVTTPACTIVDLAPRLTTSELERVIGEADKLDLIHVQQLHEALEQMRGRPGVAIVRKLIDRRTYVLTHSELERLFPPIAQRAGVTDLQSQVWLDGKRVDFYSPSLEIVFETDGGRFHRTPMQRATDDRRDQDHAAAGRLPLRFGHGQIAFEAEDVEARLTAIVSTRRSRDRSSGRGGPTPPSASAAAAARTRAA